MSANMSFQFSRQRGFSLVELMIALTIGLIISLALATMFSQVSVTNKEQFKAALQIENGRYAMDLLNNDLRLAGYYGDYAQLPPGDGTLPDPCVVPTQGTDVTNTGSLAFYVQGYPASSLTSQATVPTACQTWIDSNTLKPGSDILVVRRLDTIPLINPPTTTSAIAEEAAIYAQTTDSVLAIQYGSGDPIDRYKNAKGIADVDSAAPNTSASPSALTRRDFTPTVACTPSSSAIVCPLAAAYIRKLHVDIYFVANCRKGTGSNGKCRTTDDTIPTLKRLELTVDANVSPKVPTFTIVPLAEGIEFLKVYYGIDKNGDGQVDKDIEKLPQPTLLADWQNVVQAELRLIAVNNESSSNFADTNSYDLGRDGSGNALTYTPTGNSAKFRRHVFDQQVYIVNVGGRREK